MFRFLYVADNAAKLIEFAQVPARVASSRGWHVDAMARGASLSEGCGSTFRSVFEPFWTANPLDPRNLGSASRRFCDFVERSEYDVVHVVSPSASFLARHALRPLRGMPYPRIVVSGATVPGLLERLAIGSRGRVTVPAAWDSVYARALDLGTSPVPARPRPRVSVVRTAPALA